MQSQLVKYINYLTLPASPGRAANQFQRVKNIDSACCTGFTQIAFLHENSDKKLVTTGLLQLVSTIVFRIKAGLTQNSPLFDKFSPMLSFTSLVDSVQHCKIKFIFGFTYLFCPDEVPDR